MTAAKIDPFVKEYLQELVLIYRRSPSGKFHYHVMPTAMFDSLFYSRKKWRVMWPYLPEHHDIMLRSCKEESRWFNRVHNVVFGEVAK